jgi:hypothetical protein
MRRWFIFFGSLAIFSSYVSAQHHSAMGMGAAAVRPASVSAAAGNHLAPTSPIRTSTGTQSTTRFVTARPRTGGTAARVVRSNNTPARRPADFDDDAGFSRDFEGAPGLGFDEVHLAATRGRTGNHRHERLGGGFFPFLDGGFVFPSAAVIEQAPANETQQEEVAEPERPESTRRVRSREAAPVYPTETEAGPQRESEQYVFVRRDGTLFFAVAYSWDNQTLLYITQEGLRRSVTREALDLAATQQFNEQRGLNFISPA